MNFAFFEALTADESEELLAEFLKIGRQNRGCFERDGGVQEEGLRCFVEVEEVLLVASVDRIHSGTEGSGSSATVAPRSS